MVQICGSHGADKKFIGLLEKKGSLESVAPTEVIGKTSTDSNCSRARPGGKRFSFSFV